MKYILSVLFLFFFFSGFTQIYQEMPQYGYRANRMAFDSTLQIPTVCGVPTLKSVVSVNRKAAIAFDSCNNKFYTYNPKTLTWSEVSGGGTTPSLQDVATVGNYYVNDNVDTLRLNSYDAILDIKHPIIWTNDIGGGSPNNILDFSYGPSSYENVAKIKFGDATSSLGHGYIEMTDKQSYFKNEMSQRIIIQNSPSTGGNAATNQITYFPSMKGNTDTLATTEDIRNSAIDTSNKWVNNIYRTSGVDSIYYTIGSTTYAIKDSAGGGSSQNGRFGNDTATIVMAKVHNDAGVTLTNGKVVAFSTSGTNSNAPSVKLANNKADSTSATTFGFVSGTIAINDTGWIILSGKIEKLNTSAFANGDIIYLDSISGQWTKSKPHAPYHLVYLGTVVKANAGNGSIYVKVQNGYELDEIHDVQIISKQNNQILVYSDTQQLWKNRSIYSVVDTTNKIATKTNLALKLNLSDTATMLTPYLRKTDTASLSSRINLKLNISDTATMLTPYLRSNTASATYLAKSDSSTYYTKYRSDTSRTNIYDALNGKQGTLTLTTTGTSGAATLAGNTLNIPQYSGGTSYTFSTGLTNSANTITNNLSTGVAGGQSVVGGTAASNSLTLSSTSNATKGKILFGTSAYDEVNNRLGIGVTSPTTSIDISSAANTGVNVKNTSASGRADLYVYNDAGNFGGFAIYGSTFGAPYSNNVACAAAKGMFYLSDGGIANGGTSTQQFITGGFTNSATMTLTAGNTGNVLIGTSTNAGYKLDVNGTARVQGALNFNPTNTAAGTTGNQTINKTSGTVNIAAAGTTVTVTNNLVTTSSIVFAVLRTNDGTATIKNVVPAAGSFTINLAAAATAEVSIGFFVIN